MTYFIQPQLWISDTTKAMGLKLIKELNITKAYDMAFYLQVNSSFDDQQATLTWIQHYLDEHQDQAHYDDVRYAFMARFPESMFAGCF